MTYQDNGRVALVVPGMQELENEFHQTMQRYVDMALANTPEYLSDKMALTIAESFYGGTKRDFDVLVTYFTEMASPNKPILYSELYALALSEYAEESGLLDHARIGHNCGVYTEPGSVLALAEKHPGVTITCPGCILSTAFSQAVFIAAQAVNNFHGSVSELFHYTQVPNTHYTTIQRHGDLFTCNEVNSVYPREMSPW